MLKQLIVKYFKNDVVSDQEQLLKYTYYAVKWKFPPGYEVPKDIEPMQKWYRYRCMQPDSNTRYNSEERAVLQKA